MYYGTTPVVRHLHYGATVCKLGKELEIEIHIHTETETWAILEFPKNAPFIMPFILGQFI